MLTNFLVTITVVSLVIILLYSYIKDSHTKALPKTNPWDIVSKEHINQKATFFAREGGIVIVKESSNKTTNKLFNKPNKSTKRKRRTNTLTNK